MKTEELLDRLEILYPKNELLTDLRKAILDDNRYSLYRVIKHINNTPLVEAVRKIENLENFNQDSFSRGQIKSKLWLVEELEKLDLDLGTVFLCAGWYATLAAMLFESQCKITKVRSFDIDPSCSIIADTVNKSKVVDEWKFKASTLDIHEITYPLNYKTYRFNNTAVELTDDPDTIINTSCEHIENFNQWYSNIPNGKILVLQTNNYFDIDDHINCSDSLDSFKKQTPMSVELYSGELDLVKYTRYMRIGIK
jgi:hypothetical protein